MEFLCSDKAPSKSGKKTIHHEPVHARRIKKSHPLGRNLTRDSASLVPGETSDPSGEISLSYMDAHGGLL